MTKRKTQALNAALDLLRMPSKVRGMRLAPLPSGIFLLLRLAAEDVEAQTEARRINKRAPDAHRQAAIFFIEQILLSSNSDPYRMLGLDMSATKAELRRHMVYLLKWLHPDLSGDPHKAKLARRVLLAWSKLRAGGSQERKSLHDRCIHRHARKRPLVVARSVDDRRKWPLRNSAWLAKRLRLRGWPR